MQQHDWHSLNNQNFEMLQKQWFSVSMEQMPQCRACRKFTVFEHAQRM